MCGIIGYVGPQESVPILLEGLRRMEYRGYDSAGLAVLNGEGLKVEKSAVARAAAAIGLYPREARETAVSRRLDPGPPGGGKPPRLRVTAHSARPPASRSTRAGSGTMISTDDYPAPFVSSLLPQPG